MTPLQYDPNEQFDPDAWLALDESERMQLVIGYHRSKRIRLPNETAHAVIHVVVENQIAFGEAFPAKNVLIRLMSEGLDRHEAIHAIGSVLSKSLYAAMIDEDANEDPNRYYLEKLEALSAESWRAQAL